MNCESDTRLVSADDDARLRCVGVSATCARVCTSRVRLVCESTLKGLQRVCLQGV